MKSTVFRVALCFVFCLSSIAVHAKDQAFKHAGVASDALRYEKYLKSNWGSANVNVTVLRSEAARLLARGQARKASRSFAQIVASNSTDVEAWLGLARALLVIKPDKRRGSERYRLPVNASASAYTAYQRAKSDDLRAEALSVLSDALKRRSYWRPAINALKASLQLRSDPQVRQAYEVLRAERGFRITNYKVDSDAAQPRLCVRFSERLAKGQSDFAKFIVVDGRDPQNVTIEPRRLCIEGLTHGRRYEVQVRAGLPSAIGEDLLKTAELGIYIRDRKASVRFTGRNYVLPRTGQQGIPVVTVNTKAVKVEVYRIGDRSLAATLQGGNFQKQLSGYQLARLRDQLGARVYVGTMPTKIDLNKDVTTAFPVSDALPKLQAGVYVMTVGPINKSGIYDGLATQWFIVSDLGLTAMSGANGLHAFVRSLTFTDPTDGVEVRLLARNNEVLATAKTDNHGYARFAAGLLRGEGGLAPAVLVATTPGGDYAFLDLAAGAFDLTDRGVKGRTTPGPLDGYLYADRGVYKPGAEVFLTALVRDRAGRAVSSLPLTLVVARPDGVEHRRLILPAGRLGGHAYTLSLASSVMTGTWRARVHTDPKADAIAEISFLVEDFAPERMALELTAKAKALEPSKSTIITAAGRYLYGPVAADLALEGEVVVKPSNRDVPGFAGYVFGMADQRISTVRKSLDDLGRTGKNGKAAIAVSLPALTKTQRPLEARVTVRLREPGGRTIERSVTLPVDLRQPRIGIKAAFAGGRVGEGETANFDVVLLDGEGKPRAAPVLNWELLKIHRSYQWYSRDGRWQYEPVSYTRRVATGTAASTEGLPAKIAAKVGWGRYRLEVSTDDAAGPATSIIFTAGWWSKDGADSPEILDLALDQESYEPGDTAKLTISSRHGGKALIAVVREGLVTIKQVDIAKGGGEVALKVGADWMPGVYVTAMLYRPTDVKAKRMPSRSIGVRWLKLNPASRTLKVGLAVPKKIGSGGRLSVPVKLDGLKPGEAAHVTVAAVDVGILSLTRFKAPAPEDWFYAQRRMGLEMRDLYGRLIDGMRAERGKLRSGGDSDAGVSMKGSPPVEHPLALFSGILTVGPNGTATAEFDMPEFNGAVRVMAVAWSTDKLGHATADVIVRDPVALLISGPRFMTLGDQARLRLDLHNVEGAAGGYELSVGLRANDADEQNLLARTVPLSAGERRFEDLQIKAKQVGSSVYTVRIKGPGGIDVVRRFALKVNPPARDIRRVTHQTLAKAGGSIEVSIDVLANLIPSRSKISVAVGPLARLDVPGLLLALDRYPYGCAEQTVSRALPLLYVNAVASRIGMAVETKARSRIAKAISRLWEMQDSSGAFGVWGPASTDMWLTAYVTDFLTRAKETGHAVPPAKFAQALDRLRNYVSYSQDFKKGGESLAYALYVLARNGRAPVGDLRYFVDTRLNRFTTPLARAQLGAALAMIADKPRAQLAFQSAIALLDPDRNTGSATLRRDFGSSLRDGAAVLALASESKVARAEAVKLIDVVATAYAAKRYTSTQEQAWMLLAAKALSVDGGGTALTVNGKPHVGALTTALSAKDLSAGSYKIVNTSASPVHVVVSVIGAALTPEPAIERGFKIERTYYTLDGKPAALASANGGKATLAQNTRLVVVLKVTPLGDTKGGRVLLVDRLPAGLEIENPRLVTASNLKSLSWLVDDLEPRTSQFRDDRFVAAFNLFGKKKAGTKTSFSVAYMVRAVTPGSFIHPAATIEDMYRPERFARSASGRLEITVSK